MTLTVYIHSKCSTCKNALSFLTLHGIPFIQKEITKTPPSRAELEKMLFYMSDNVKKLFNTSGILYKEMNLSSKLPEMSPQDALSLLSEHGMLVKRPFLLGEEFGILGFNEDVWQSKLNNF